MTQPLQVLFVEDNPADVELLLRTLRKEGFAPAWTQVDTEAGFRAALHGGLDLVLSDFQMPQFTGLRALEVAKAAHPEVPFIIVSGTIGEDKAVEAMRLGATDYLLKDRLARLGPSVTRALSEARLRRERQLREEDFCLLFAQNPMPMWVYDIGTLRFLAVNDAAIEHYGYSRDEFMALTLRDIRPPEEVPRLLESLQNRPPGMTRPGIWRHRKKDGTVIMVEPTAHRTTFQGSASELVLAYDVTQRLATEKALLESEARLRTVTETAGIGLVMVDENHRYRYFNQAYMRLLRLSPGDLLGRRVADVLAPVYETQIRPRLDLAFGGKRVDYELVMPSAGGDRHYNVFYEKGSHDGEPIVVVVIVDITERKETEMKVREQLAELLRWQEVMLDREDRVLALKAEINTLLAQQNLPPRYDDYHSPA